MRSKDCVDSARVVDAIYKKGLNTLYTCCSILFYLIYLLLQIRKWDPLKVCFTYGWAARPRRVGVVVRTLSLPNAKLKEHAVAD